MNGEHDTTAPGDEAGSGIAVALSGGGHRACLFGLGALLYLIDAGKGPAITSVASVSGGSLANGAIAQSVDLKALRRNGLDGVAARVAGQITGRGTLFGAWTTYAYIALTALLALAALACLWLPLSFLGRLLLFAAGALLVGWVAGLRGRVCALAFERTLFRGSSTRLADIENELDHVFCATDLHMGGHVYFSGGFVFGYRYGIGEPADVRLSRVVQASAAFPGAFPVSWLPTAPHRFDPPAEDEDATAEEKAARAKAAATGRMALVDGGVYDNMADQWAQSLADWRERFPGRPSRFREAGEIVVVNASAGMSWDGLGKLRLPLLGELLTLLRDKTILYENGNSRRRAELIQRFRRAEREGKGMTGSLVHIPRSPFKVPKGFARGEGPRGERARKALAALAEEGGREAAEERWEAVAAANAGVPTTLSRLGVETAARLMHHAYVLAMVNLHVILGYPLLEMPPRERFEAIARGEAPELRPV